MTIGAARATYDDVNLVIKLYELRRDDRLRDARRWFGASFKVKTLDEFNALCPMGSEQNEFYRMVVTYWDMVASFLTSGVVNQELFFQSGGEMIFVWERVRDVLPHLRASYGNPLQLKNLEQAAAAFIQWWNKQAPGAYDAFAADSGLELHPEPAATCAPPRSAVPPSARSKVVRARAEATADTDAD